MRVFYYVHVEQCYSEAYAMTQEQALTILKTGANVFLTGEPGSGKTHTVNQYIAYLRDHEIEPAITASTGIAATHIGGMTIHSWSGIGIKKRLTPYDLDRIVSTEHVVKRVRRTKILIIDEISMLSGTMLDMVDAVCQEVHGKHEAFGGMQVIFVGDFFQLPPVVRSGDEVVSTDDLFGSPAKSHFAFGASSWKHAQPITCYLTEQHRQKDTDFLAVLSAIRGNCVEEMHVAHIERRQTPFDAIPDTIPKLFAYNADVDRVNVDMLATLQTPTKTFQMTSEGGDALVEALKKGCLSPETLVLKEGAVVMCTKNNLREGFVNGTQGTVVGFSKGSGYPIIETRNKTTCVIEPMEWTIEENGRVRARITQIPLRLAWAITVHKSQGMSMDAVAMDLSQVFEFGQGYVALSRVRALEGLFMLGWNERSFQVDPTIQAQDELFRNHAEEAKQVFNDLSPEEVTAMHTNFIKACGGVVVVDEKKTSKTKRVKNKQKSSTYTETAELVQAGKTLAEIVRCRKLHESTILTHCEKLYRDKVLTPKDIEHLVSSNTRNAIDRIHKVFIELDTEKLTPVYEYFGGKYSYADLRLVRLLMSNKYNTHTH